MASGHVSRANSPNTWLLRPILRREDSSCQPGAVHTWPISEVATPLTVVSLVGRSGRDLLTLSFSLFDRKRHLSRAKRAEERHSELVRAAAFTVRLRRSASHARSDVNGNAADIIADYFALASELADCRGRRFHVSRQRSGRGRGSTRASDNLDFRPGAFHRDDGRGRFFARLLQTHRWIAYVGLAVILYVAGEMIFRGTLDVIKVASI
ncbi:hypothetical protein ABIB83_008752 [Bradyrhizobium sp. I1.8.5]